MDVEGLLRVRAARVRAEAEALQRYALRVAALRDLPWESLAADLFRARVTERSGQLAALSRRVEALAVDLDALATAVRAARQG